MKKALLFLLFIVIFSSYVFPTAFTPNSPGIEGLGIRQITNFTNVSADKFCDKTQANCATIGQLLALTGGGGGASKWVDGGTFLYPNTSFASNIKVFGYIQADDWSNVSIDVTQVNSGGDITGVIGSNGVQGGATSGTAVLSLNRTYVNDMCINETEGRAIMDSIDNNVSKVLINIDTGMSKNVSFVLGKIDSAFQSNNTYLNNRINAVQASVVTNATFLSNWIIAVNNSVNVYNLVKSYFFEVGSLIGYSNLTKCPDNQILKMSGSEWVCAADNAGSGASGFTQTSSIYLYNLSSTIYFNDTKVNETIDARISLGDYASNSDVLNNNTAITAAYTTADNSIMGSILNNYSASVIYAQNMMIKNATDIFSKVDSGMSKNTSAILSKVDSGMSKNYTAIMSYSYSMVSKNISALNQSLLAYDATQDESMMSKNYTSLLGKIDSGFTSNNSYNSKTFQTIVDAGTNATTLRNQFSNNDSNILAALSSGLAAQDSCSEISGCVVGAITDGNDGWDNSYGFVANGTDVWFTKNCYDSGCTVYDSWNGSCLIRVTPTTTDKQGSAC